MSLNDPLNFELVDQFDSSMFFGSQIDPFFSQNKVYIPWPTYLGKVNIVAGSTTVRLQVRL